MVKPSESFTLIASGFSVPQQNQNEILRQRFIAGRSKEHTGSSLPSTSGSFPSPPNRTAFTFQTPGLKSLFNDLSSANFFSLSLQLMHHSFSTRTDKQYFRLTHKQKMYFFSSKCNSITPQTFFALAIIFQEIKHVNAICVTNLYTAIFKMH